MALSVCIGNMALFKHNQPGRESDDEINARRTPVRNDPKLISKDLVGLDFKEILGYFRSS